MELLPSGKGKKSKVSVVCKVESLSIITYYQSGSIIASWYHKGLERLWIEVKNDVKESK